MRGCSSSRTARRRRSSRRSRPPGGSIPARTCGCSWPAASSARRSSTPAEPGDGVVTIEGLTLFVQPGIVGTIDAGEHNALTLVP